MRHGHFVKTGSPAGLSVSEKQQNGEKALLSHARRTHTKSPHRRRRFREMLQKTMPDCHGTTTSGDAASAMPPAWHP